MDDLAAIVDGVASETGFAGVVRVDRGGETALTAAYGLADRRHGIANAVDLRYATASGTKGLTALVVMRLVESGVLSLSTTARSLLGSDLPLIGDDVTVEHLLAHRSGIGDYLDEDTDYDVDDDVLAVPVHELVTTEDYLRVLDGCPTKFAAGERFSYCNGGFVVLALLAERAAGRPFHALVRELVCEPAGMESTAFVRSDELPPDAALGYLETGDDRTNVFHLPVQGSGDGGIYTTLADVHALWDAFLGGRIVSPVSVSAMTQPVSDVPSEGARYGLGFWLHPWRDVVMLVGMDAGVSFLSACSRSGDVAFTVLANTSVGAWPVARALRQALFEQVTAGVEPIYHLALQDEWDAARMGGAGYRRSTLGLSLVDVGFVHCSFEPQVQPVFDAFYAGRSDVVRLRIDPSRLTSEVRVEPGEGTDEQFPHVYGPLDLDAVVATEPWGRA